MVNAIASTDSHVYMIIAQKLDADLPIAQHDDRRNTEGAQVANVKRDIWCTLQ